MRRRLVTVPAVVLSCALSVPLLPVLLLGALVVDLARRSRALATTRFVAACVGFLAVETTGLLLLAWTGLVTRAGSEARVERTFAVQRRYTAAHFGVVRRVYSLRVVVEGGDLVMPGPLLVLVRHASLLDVLLPGVFLSGAHGLRLRYILKRELLVVPCFDIGGHWLPNAFVDRSGRDTAHEVAAVRALKEGLGPRDGVLLYPEGTRFSASRREALLRRLEGPARARAEALHHLLPIHPGGVLALLDAPPPCDVLVVGHHGLEGFTRLGDVWRGTLVGRTVTMKVWRHAMAEVPTGDEARLRWVDQLWQQLDAWLESAAGRDDAPLPGRRG